jgi:chromosomal replication initiator protein
MSATLLDAAAVQAAWPGVLIRLRAGALASAVKMWLDPTKVRAVVGDDGQLVLECPNPLFRATIEKRLEQPLRQALQEALSQEIPGLRYVISGSALREHERRRQETEEGAAAAAALTAPSVARPRGFGHGYKVLSDFVVGSANRLAYDAVMQVLDSPRALANPLFIHGKSGLGKTHLTQGLAMAFKERNPKAKVLYLRCEQFTNEFLGALQGGSIQAFRIKMRHPELLLIDDLHFLSQGTMLKTKQELFSTFNELAEQGRQVVFTSDASPRAIKYLEDSFVQRFSGGLVVELQRPDPRLRADVVRGKALAHGLDLPDPVVEYVSEHITDNIRELEGAVNKLAQFARSFQRTVDLAAARQALADLLLRPSDETVQDMILREVADRFGVAAKELTAKRKTGPLPEARHVAMYLMKLAGDEGYERIGRVFGLGHTGVLYGCRKVTERRQADTDLDRFITELLLRAKRG